MTEPALTTHDLRYYARILLAAMTADERVQLVAASESLTAQTLAPWVIAEAAGFDLDTAIRAEMADVMRHPEATR